MRLLIIHDGIPDPSRSGASVRLLQLIRSLRALGHYVTFASARPPSREDDLSGYARRSMRCFSETN